MMIHRWVQSKEIYLSVHKLGCTTENLWDAPLPGLSLTHQGGPARQSFAVPLLRSEEFALGSLIILIGFPTVHVPRPYVPPCLGSGLALEDCSMI